MDLDALSAVLQLYHANVYKLQVNLNEFRHEVDAVYQTLGENWENIGHIDRSMLHDRLLHSVCEANEHVIKLNLRINLNKSGALSNNENYNNGKNTASSVECESLENAKHTNKDGIVVGDNEVDVQRMSQKDLLSNNKGADTAVQLMTLSADISKATYRPVSPLNIAQSVDFQATKELNANVNPSPPSSVSSSLASSVSSSIVVPNVSAVTLSAAFANAAPTISPSPLLATSAVTLPVIPPKARKSLLLPPNGGQQRLSQETYDNIPKNVEAFVIDREITATVMQVNELENCFYVAEWGVKSKPIQDLLSAEVQLQELTQFPDFGDIFAMYDKHELIIPRVILNAYIDDRRYDAYLLDYGDYMQLDGTETIYSLPDYIKKLPAEAVKCHLENNNVKLMQKYKYKKVQLRVLENNGSVLLVNVLENDATQLDTAAAEQPKQESGVHLTESEWAQLNHYEVGTSDAVRAVMGFKPMDDKRICRHYDPKINGCFKGARCRLVHQLFAPYGATKDVDLVEPFPDVVHMNGETKGPQKSMRMLITYIKTPTHVYGQFVDELAPLVWTKKEVQAKHLQFKSTPRMLDVVLACYCDGNFYRAQIIEEMDKMGEFKIFYVDYGNTEFVPLSSLMPCDNAISLKPNRAQSCIIAGIARKPLLSHEKIAECVEFLKSKILNEEIDVMIVRGHSDGYMIKLLGRFAELPKQMVKRGYVQTHCGSSIDVKANQISETSLSDE